MKCLKTIWMLIVALFVCPDTYCDGAVQISEYNFDDLLKAIATVESGNNPSAHNKAEDAVGLYQIRKIYVDDINRILGKPHFSYKNRWSAYKSRLMVGVYLNHYGRGKTIEQLARIHNGGPRGHEKKATEKYWLKVKKVLEQ